MQYKLAAATNWSVATRSVDTRGGLALYHIFRGLTLGSTYNVRVRAKWEGGNDSIWVQAQGTLSGGGRDNNLSGLTLTASDSATGTFNYVKLLSRFSPNHTYYYAVVPNTLTHVKVTPTTRDSNASVTVDGASASSGSPSDAITFALNKEILVVVTNPGPRTYTVELRRPGGSDPRGFHTFTRCPTCSTEGDLGVFHRRDVDPHADLIADMKQWRDDPRYVGDKNHTDRWDRTLLAFGVTVSDTTLTPMTASEAQGYADRGWNRWTDVAEALRELENG